MRWTGGCHCCPKAWPPLHHLQGGGALVPTLGELGSGSAAELASNRDWSGSDWRSLPSWREAQGQPGTSRQLSNTERLGRGRGTTRIMSHTALLPRVGACCCRTVPQGLPPQPQSLQPLPHRCGKAIPAASAPAVPGGRVQVRDAGQPTLPGTEWGQGHACL